VTTPNQLLRWREACAISGDRKTTFFGKILDGLMVQGVGLGGKMRAWPLGELEAINAARIAGKSDDEIRALVVELETKRTGTPATPRRKPAPQPEQLASASV